MTLARFALQAMVVVTLGGIVSFPEQRRVSAGALTRESTATRGRVGIDTTAAVGRLSDPNGRQARIGYGSLSEYLNGAAAAATLRDQLYARGVDGSRRKTPPGLLSLGAKINAIVGYALVRKSAIPFARVVLRNVETGLVEARAVADEYGRFTFVDVAPSAYLVEVVDRNGAVISTSDVMTVGLNDIQGPSFRSAAGITAASFGNAPTSAAQELVRAAESQGVSRVAAPERCASPPCSGNQP